MLSTLSTTMRAGIALIALLLFAGGCSDDDVREAALQARAEAARARHDLPAVGLAAISSGRIATAVSGVRKAGESRAALESDQFHIGSNVKPMLATVIMQLIGEGHLRLDTHMEEVLPEVAATQLADHREITLEDLLTHRSGLLALENAESLLTVPELSGTPVEQRVQFAAWVTSVPAQAPRGTFLYSNAGYVVAVAMAERVTNKSWETLLQERLLQPLRISATFNWPAAGHRDQPWGHERLQSASVPSDPDAPENQVPVYIAPAGHISMSLADYAKFVQLHLRGLRGSAQLVTAAAFQDMHRPRGTYALGWGVLSLNGQPTSWHEGSSGSFHALAIVQPSVDRAVVVVTNVSDVGTLTSEAVNQVALALLETGDL